MSRQHDLYQYYLENPDSQPRLSSRRMDFMPWMDGGKPVTESPKQKRDHGTWLHPILPADHAEREADYQKSLKMRDI